MSLQRFIPRRRQPAIKSFLDPPLDTCSYVFVRAYAKKGPHYDGPFLILEKRPKYIMLLMNGHKNSASIDRLKVAHLPIVTIVTCPIAVAAFYLLTRPLNLSAPNLKMMRIMNQTSPLHSHGEGDKLGAPFVFVIRC